MNIQFLRRLVGSFLLTLLAVFLSAGQTPPQPTRVPGANTVSRVGSEFVFRLGGSETFRYSIADGPLFNQTGGSFHAIKARAPNGQWFWPSNGGGITFFDPGSNTVLPAWDNRLQYGLQGFSLQADTVVAEWTVAYNNDPRKKARYSFRLHGEGRTLIIRVEVTTPGSLQSWDVDLDRSEDALHARIIRIPELPLFNIMYSNCASPTSGDGVFTSMFFDWERTSCSNLQEFNPSLYPLTYPAQTEERDPALKSVRYAHIAQYKRKSNGKPNEPLKEWIYLTVSSNLDDVYPNVSGGSAPKKDAIAAKTVLSFGPPYRWLLPYTYTGPKPHGYSTDYLAALYNAGVRDLAVIIKQYQRHGFDNGYPEVWPPYPFHDVSEYGRKIAAGRNGDLTYMKILRRKLVDTLHFEFALHENYVDYYETPRRAKYDPTLRPVPAYPASGHLKGWHGSWSTAWILKPSKVVGEATFYHNQVKECGTTWSYLDVHTASNPGDRVDYDAAADSAGYFTKVLSQYRALAPIMRKTQGTDGPVEGEGRYHMLYAGCFDDFEGNLFTADHRYRGHVLPLLVDFDLRKLRGKSAFHGVGHYDLFFWDDRTIAEGQRRISEPEMLTLIASELAYGHGGLVTKAREDDMQLTVLQARLEQIHNVPLQRTTMNIPVQSIQYYERSGGGPFTASQYIATHPYFDILNHNDFMGRVKVTYSNGIVVWVNRTSKAWPVNAGGGPGSWFARNVTDEKGPTAAYVQEKGRTFLLSPFNGWLIYWSVAPN
jgi:hypothetical protein